MNYEFYNEKNPTRNNKKVFILLLGIVLFSIILIYFSYSGIKRNGEEQYSDLVEKLCSSAKKYARDNEGIIDKNSAGDTAYIKLQKLSDAFLIESEIKDPRYVIGFNRSDKYISLSTFVRLSVSTEGQVYCEGLVDVGEDKIAPIVTLNGSEEVIIAKGTNFLDPGAKSVDNTDGNITSKIQRSGTVDTTKTGEYEIKYTSSDISGNTTEIERKILVKEYKELKPTIASNLDTILPEIQLKGENPMCINLNSKYVEPGVTAIDNIDGNISSKIVVDNKVSGERTGIFRVTYTVEDSSGNTAIAYRSVEVKEKCGAVEEQVKEIHVNQKPSISLIGGTSVIWNKNEEYIDRGANAWDSEDGNITNKIQVDYSNVNVKIAGIYDVYYEVTDSEGLKAKITRKVTIKDNTVSSNVASFKEIPENINIPIGKIPTISVPSAVDSYNKNINVVTEIQDMTGKVVKQIDFNSIGKYKIMYSATPNGGVRQIISRNVTVYDDFAPILTAPKEITIEKRNSNCNVTQDDLYDNGIIVTDGLNSKKPNLVIKNGENKVCNSNNSSFEIQVYATDESGNKSEEKAIKINIHSEQKIETKTVSNVSILNCGSNKETTLYKGGTLQISAVVYPNDATNKEVIWKTNNSTVATVKDGLISGVGKGTADITVISKDGNKQDICTVIVKEVIEEVHVSDVIIDNCQTGNINLEKGKSIILNAIVSPINAVNKTVEWTERIGNQEKKSESSTKVITPTSLDKITVSVKTIDANKTKTCNINVIETNVKDTTPPSKVIVKSNSANTKDPYNKSGNWYGGNSGRSIKLVVETKDKESEVSKFEILDSNKKLIKEFTPQASNPNIGEYYWNDDINTTIYIRAVNTVGLKSELSNPITIKLDNIGPTIKFTLWNEDSNKWVNTNSYTVKYSATDNGSGISKYEYTHDDVKTLIAKGVDVKIEGSTSSSELKFLESSGKEYVYVRAIDSQGNIGSWTEKPSWLNMDTTPPMAPKINVLNNNTDKVTVGFAFTDGNSIRKSGFLKYVYKLDDGKSNTISLETETFDITEIKTHKVEAWSYDKAGNRSINSSIDNNILVIAPLKINCSSNVVIEGQNLMCDITYSDYYKDIIWASSNEKVAVVNSNGTVNAKASGTTIITVKSSNGKTASFNITVEGSKNDKSDKIYFVKNNLYEGHGDAIIFESNEKYAMIDTFTKVACKNLTDFISSKKIKELEFIIITHFHSDHMGCISTLSSIVNIKTIFYKYPNEYANDKEAVLKNYNKIMNLKMSKINFTTDTDLTFENFKLHIYNVEQRLTKKTGLKNNSNTESLVISAMANNHKTLLAGDIYQLPEETYFKDIANSIGKVELYKASHHGIIDNNPKSILKILDPKYSILTISTTSMNEVQQTKNNLQDIGSKVYFGANGVITADFSDDSLNISQKK